MAAHAQGSVWFPADHTAINGAYGATHRLFPFSGSL